MSQGSQKFENIQCSTHFCCNIRHRCVLHGGTGAYHV